MSQFSHRVGGFVSAFLRSVVRRRFPILLLLFVGVGSVVWLFDVTNVSVTPYTYTEEFVGEHAVLSRDNLTISFAVHTVWRVHPGWADGRAADRDVRRAEPGTASHHSAQVITANPV
ncbi:MAG: hypothetical protein ACRD2A_09605, partial [Vicinamibacterales bacterium]